MSARIKIYNPNDATEFIEMPRTKDITYTKEAQSKEMEMISGRKVKDVKGFRKVISASWDAVPAETIVQLNAYLSTGAYLTVTHPGLSGDETTVFDVSFPTLSIFKFENGQAVWHGVNLKMTAQEVES